MFNPACDYKTKKWKESPHGFSMPVRMVTSSDGSEANTELQDNFLNVKRGINDASVN